MADPKRIVLMNFGGLGDEILFSPVIQALREGFPHAHLSLILEDRSQGVSGLLPQLNQVIPVRVQGEGRLRLFQTLLDVLRRQKADAVLSSGSSPFIALLLALSGIAIRVGYESGPFSRLLLTKAAPLNRKAYAGAMYFSLAQTFFRATHREIPSQARPLPKLDVEGTEKAKAKALLENALPHVTTRLLIHPGVSRVSIEKNILKAWPPTSWLQLMETFLIRHPEAGVCLLGGPDDEAVIETLTQGIQAFPQALQGRIANMYGKTQGLSGLAGLLSQGDVLVSVDSAPMHLAIGLGTPVVAIFGPTDPKKLVPSADHVKVAMVDNLACRPCLWDSRSQSCDKPLCLDVPVSQVLDHIESLLHRPQAAGAP